LISRAEAIAVKKSVLKKDTTTRIPRQKGEIRKQVTLLDRWGGIIAESPCHLKKIALIKYKLN
jgi:hypothetical protein